MSVKDVRWVRKKRPVNRPSLGWGGSTAKYCLFFRLCNIPEMDAIYLQTTPRSRLGGSDFFRMFSGIFLVRSSNFA
eukprot:UN07252